MIGFHRLRDFPFPSSNFPLPFGFPCIITIVQAFKSSYKCIRFPFSKCSLCRLQFLTPSQIQTYTDRLTSGLVNQLFQNYNDYVISRNGRMGILKNFVSSKSYFALGLYPLAIFPMSKNRLWLYLAYNLDDSDLSKISLFLISCKKIRQRHSQSW